MILRRLHFALFLLLAVVAAVPYQAHALATVSGVVRNSAGVPQMGAQVQLLRPDLTVLATVTTDSRGAFSFQSVFPGKYSIKAIGASFLPSLRENVRVRTATVVSLTLNTLYEVMQWLPTQPRNVGTPKDDWAWTLRSAANRPLLRWLEDGPLVVVSDGPGAKPKLKARLVASGQQGSFGEDGERISMEVEDTPSESRELLARVDFDPSTDAGMESMLGFRQDLGFAGSVESVAAVAIHPDVEASGTEGLDEATLKTTEHIAFGDSADTEVGSEQVLARFSSAEAGNSVGANTIFAALPFADVDWHKGDSTIRYRMATAMPPIIGADESQASGLMPAVAVSSDGNLTLEHGLHQEIGWERRTDNGTGFQVLVYADSVSNPVLEAGTHSIDNRVIPAGVLLDSESSILRAAGPGFSTAGVVASFEKRLHGGNSVRLSYANGDALVIPVATRSVLPLAALVTAARPRRTQMYSLSLSGTIEGTGTRWRASYRWQPEETLTRVAPFALDADEPFLNLHVRQPMCRTHGERTRSVDAMIDVRNLLAQGYRPFVLPDGSVLVFAQDQRSLSAGLAFTF